MSENESNANKSQENADENLNANNSKVSLIKDDKENNTLNRKSIKEKIQAYPKHVFFIIGNEFCERFTFYGMRAVLLLYLRNYLGWTDDQAISIYHVFVMFVYFFPILGGIAADSWLGRFHTIVYLSVVYVLGNVFQTIGAIPYIPSYNAHLAFSMLGLFLIAMGTGGIKPCVSSFGGDQFTADQAVQRKQFFSIFYFSINAGSLIAVFVMPLMRANLDCYPGHEGPLYDECYSLAFGVPGILMLTALILFVCGKHWYTILPHDDSAFLNVCKCIKSAVKNKYNTPKNMRNKPSWLDYSDSPASMVRDTKYVIQILILFIPIPAFWALFEQQGSRWVLQAIQLNRNVGSAVIEPDQIQLLNPLLILSFIPLFEIVIYPLLERMKINFTSLKKMFAGFVLTGLAFIIAAILQIQIDNSLTTLPTSNEYGVRFVNSLPCNINISYHEKSCEVNSQSVSSIKFFKDGNDIKSFAYKDCERKDVEKNLTNFNHQLLEVTDMYISSDGIINTPMLTKVPEDGTSKFSIYNLCQGKRTVSYEIEGNEENLAGKIECEKRSDNITVMPGNLKVKLSDGVGNVHELSTEVKVGGLYTIVANTDIKKSFQTEDMKPTLISVFWQLPQFIVITLGEIFISITGLEFSYSQAPPTMRSVLASCWLLTVSFGNVIVLIVAQVKALPSQTAEYFLFAILVFVSALIFALLAHRYELVDESIFEEDEEEDTEEEKARKTKSELMRRLSLMRYNSVQPITVSIDHSTQIISRKPSSLVRR